MANFRCCSLDTAPVGDVVIPSAYCRDDIGERWIDGDGGRLHALSYLGPA